MKYLTPKGAKKHSVVKLTKSEALIKEIHDRLMDVGLCQWDAAQLILGGHPMQSDEPAPMVDAVFDNDPDFLVWLVR